MSSQENVDFLGVFKEYLPDFDLPTAYQVRNLVLAKINELEQKIIEDRAKFRAEMQARAEELGLTPSDLFPSEPKTKAAPKYKDPDTGKTWSGKGKKPNWVVDALNAGKSLDDLLIQTTVVDSDPEIGF